MFGDTDEKEIEQIELLLQTYSFIELIEDLSEAEIIYTLYKAGLVDLPSNLPVDI